MPEPPNHVLWNCWAYIKWIYPNTPSTAVIRSNLGPQGHIGVLYYPSSGLYHYVRVLQDDGVNVLFDETNFNYGKKTTRLLPKTDFLGFYAVPQ